MSDINTTEKISLSEKICYGFGDLASNLAFSALSAFIMYYYTDVAGIAVGTAGMIIFLSKIFDGVSDVVVGLLVDRTHSKHGKARPWILWMAAPFAIGLVLVFSVPNIGQTGKVIYAFITYTLLVAGLYTAINIPYGTMTALITQDQYQRGILNIFRMIFAAVGSLIVSSITLSVVGAFGNDAAAWRKTFIVYGVIAFCLFMCCFKGTKERVKAPERKEGEAENKISTKDSLKALFKNKYWFMMLLLQTTNYIMMGLTNNGIYFFQYNLGNRDLYSVSMVAQMVPMLLAIIFLAAPLMKHLGKRNTALIGAVSMLAGCILMAIGIHSVTFIMVGIALKGAGSGLITSGLGAMIADTIEYGEYRTGIRSEGLTYSASSFGGKVGNGLGSALAGLILSIGGYAEQAATQSADAQMAIDVMYIYLPIILVAIAVIILYCYKLDKEYPTVIAELNRRKAEGEKESE